MSLNSAPRPNTRSPAPLGQVTALHARDPRRLALGVLILSVLVLIAALLWLPGQQRHPARLEEATLVGPRPPECLRLIIADDLSGSMSSYSSARDAALTSLLAWAPGQLRPNDELALIGFAAGAETWLAPTPIGAGTASVKPSSPGPADDTLLTPVLRTAGKFPPTPCHTHLLLVGDALFSDLVQASSPELLTASGIDSVGLLLPSTDLADPSDFRQQFPYAPISTVDGLDADHLGVALAEIVAEQTGQHLTRNSTPTR